MLEVGDSFIPLLREADEVVRCRLSSASKTIDSTFSALLHELENVLSEASSGLFLDPRGNSEEMVSKLSHMGAQVHSLAVKLEQLSRDIQNLKGELPQFLNNSSSSQADSSFCFRLEIPVDLTILTVGVQLFEARKQLWELFSAVQAWMEECQELHICEVTLGNLVINTAWFLMYSSNNANGEAYCDFVLYFESIQHIFKSISFRMWWHRLSQKYPAGKKKLCHLHVLYQHMML